MKNYEKSSDSIGLFQVQNHYNKLLEKKTSNKRIIKKTSNKKLNSIFKQGDRFCFVAVRPKSTAMAMVGRSVHLATLFLGQA